MTYRAQHTIQAIVDMGQDVTPKDDFHILVGIGNGRITCSESIEDRV